VVQDIHRAFPELRGQRRHIVLQRNPATHTLFSLGEPPTIPAPRTITRMRLVYPLSGRVITATAARGPISPRRP
jgi:hypothetical protein